MKKYVVSIPIAGYIAIDVEAASEKEARDRAWETVNDKGEDAGELTWEFMDRIVTGNMCSAPLNEIEVDEVKE